MINKEQIRLLQEISCNAWPAFKIHLLNGWIIRLGEGITRRANSVLPLNYNGNDIFGDIQFTEQLYEQWNLPAVFQIPDYYEPNNLLSILEERGYFKEDESLVMASSLDKMSVIEQNNSFSYSHNEQVSKEWFQALQQFSYASENRINGIRLIINRITQPKNFFYARKKDAIVGLALVVLERSFLGIYDMITDPNYRRQGIAKSIIAEIVKYSKNQNIKNIYLQVQGDNIGAIDLYKSVHLIETFRYRYLVKS